MALRCQRNTAKIHHTHIKALVAKNEALPSSQNCEAEMVPKMTTWIGIQISGPSLLDMSREGSSAARKPKRKIVMPTL